MLFPTHRLDVLLQTEDWSRKSNLAWRQICKRFPCDGGMIVMLCGVNCGDSYVEWTSEFCSRTFQNFNTHCMDDTKQITCREWFMHVTDAEKSFVHVTLQITLFGFHAPSDSKSVTYSRNTWPLNLTVPCHDTIWNWFNDITDLRCNKWSGLNVITLISAHRVTPSLFVIEYNKELRVSSSIMEDNKFFRAFHVIDTIINILRWGYQVRLTNWTFSRENPC